MKNKGEVLVNKDEFLIELEDIVYDSLFIGGHKDDLNKEISANRWSISLSMQLASQFTVFDFMNFFRKVIENRQQQILKSNSDHGMLLYVWFDWQASQLRFNLISQIHERLPFSGKIEILDELEPIINEFIHFPYHDGIPIGEAANEGNDVQADFVREPEPVKVFLTSLPKK
ncbi:conserved hypothetical protein [Brevibacillus brevis NBRC 100599]|uniref:Uncharacterized protein n=1 Tax=Brevibacillus brevis (strain 47 / JCM 6285 / NBRC 100599) TaxID=358681 RepID=C0ZFX8_BREBN|nr:conserved hypothetical protein [Brevibacillus brevis NBRC 100599]